MTAIAFENKEVSFSPDDIIVSKTDLKGIITYVNGTFCKVSAFTERQLLGKPHSIIRHPNMPRCIFKYIWERLKTDNEIFGYVVNRTANNDYYWVLAHITPSYDCNHNIIGYHSNRRVPDKQIITQKIIPLYTKLLQIEKSTSSSKEGLTASYEHLLNLLRGKGVNYDEFILTL